MTAVPFLGYDAVLAAVSASAAIEHTRHAFERYARGEWHMSPKMYLLSPPHGDFRAMPALGDGIALLKWVSSFPDNTEHGLPAVHGLVCLSDASTGVTLAVLDARSVTALRTGAVAAVASTALAAPDARSVGVIGCGVHGQWAARCMAAAGYGPGVCFDAHPAAAAHLAQELGWAVGSRLEALGCDIVCCVTPGHEPVVGAEDLRAGMHLNFLGADGPGKAEATVEAVAACALFCDDWMQASHGGELMAAVAAGRVTQDHVTELGAVLIGASPGRRSPEEITLFDSTGLAIQDLAVAAVAWRSGSAAGVTIEL